MLGTGGAILAGTIANKLVTRLWQAASGRPAPSDPTNHDEVSWKEALLFAAVTGFVVQAARVAAERKTAQYRAKTAGRQPTPLVSADS
jgi:hypothetical protein